MLKRLPTICLLMILSSGLCMGCHLFSEKEETPAPALQTNTGTFLGQMDRNSIEIEINEQTQAFELAEAIKDDFTDFALQIGDKVSFTFETPPEGRPLITKIEKLS